MPKSKKQQQLEAALIEQKQRRMLSPMPMRYPHVLAGYWDLSAGHHPSLAKGEPIYSVNPFFDDEILPEQLADAGLPVAPCTDGHNLVVDHTFPAALGTNDKIPVSPLFVRDLSGRIIYTGYGPEAKTPQEWWPQGFGVLFPSSCRDVTDSVQGADLIENVYFTRFRTLDMAFDYDATPSGRPDLGYAAYYEKANLYPYKVRLDTFYQDGWRLPQTNMLFARREGVDTTQAKTSGAAFMAKWQTRPKGQSYEEFYEANDGDAWFESLFLSGCTVIPTIEAANGYHQVSDQFEIEDYWPGRAVEGLHEVVEYREDEAPSGTILEVVEPGYVLAEFIQPAKVIVSDGSGYVSPHKQDPAAMVPDLRLPHQRTSTVWGATWVPTHPSHFEEPAIWGWGKTGHFVQLSGPVWDPLHYYYESVPHVLRAFREPMIENEFLAEVPESLKNRFFPVKEMNGFDTISESVRQRREEMRTLPITAIDRVRDGKTYCEVGYHPLPLEFEFELDAFWFPITSPQYQADPLPEDLKQRLAPVISCRLAPNDYIATVHAPQQAAWLMDKALLATSTGEPFDDYPQLKRFFDAADEEEMIQRSRIFVGHVEEVLINLSPQDRLGDADLSDALEGFAPGLYDALYDFEEAAFLWRQRRHKLYRQSPGWYAIGAWKSILPEMIDELAEQGGSSNRQSGEQSILRTAVSAQATTI